MLKNQLETIKYTYKNISVVKNRIKLLFFLQKPEKINIKIVNKPEKDTMTIITKGNCSEPLKNKMTKIKKILIIKYKKIVT